LTRSYANWEQEILPGNLVAMLWEQPGSRGNSSTGPQKEMRIQGNPKSLELKLSSMRNRTFQMKQLSKIEMDEF
jgi:hypothetical protein